VDGGTLNYAFTYYVSSGQNAVFIDGGIASDTLDVNGNAS